MPVSKFILTLRGGRKGLLVNSRNQCKRHRSKGRRSRRGQRVIVHLKGQNGKKRKLRQRLRVPCGKHRRHRHHHHK